MVIRVTGNAAIDGQLTDNPFALLTAMLLDQQFPMERAFAGPYVITERMAQLRPGFTASDLEPATIAALDPEEFAALCSRPPAVHRFPGSMAGRIQALARHVVETYDGDAAAIWTTARDAREVLRRLRALPGFGERKSRIFLALLGKQLDVRPEGWAEAASPFGDPEASLSVADVVDAESLARVRATKQERKRARKAQKSGR
ncbi:MAG TPA: HhH-GPD-type base excision DNA repair protein [Actinopolymorphaceae bacterium]